MRIEGRGEEYGVIHLQVDRPQPLELFLLTDGIDAMKVDELLWLGSVYVNASRVMDSSYTLQIGDKVRVHSTPRRFGPFKDLKDRIVFSNSDFVVVNKPSGIPVHALTDNLRENLLSLLEQELGKKLFITHRLDIETAGLIIVALNEVAQTRINQQIENGEIQRCYRAWVEHAVELGEHVHYMSPSPKAPKLVVSEPEPGWLKCVMHVHSCLADSSKRKDFPTSGNEQFRVLIELETGRTQQIRAQLGALGSPILGDTAYNGSKPASDERKIALESYALEIDGVRIEI